MAIESPIGVGVAEFNAPYGIATDTSGNIYVADTLNQRICKITPAGAVITLAGSLGVRGSIDGTAKSARFNDPSGIAVDSSGNIFVADTSNHTIRRITPVGVVTTLAGAPGLAGSIDGKGTGAQFSSPTGVASDRIGNIFVCDTRNSTIRKISPLGIVTTIAGKAGSPGSDDGIGSAARLNNPHGLATDRHGNLYVADTENNTVRKITPAGAVSTLAGSPGRRYSSQGGTIDYFLRPTGVATDGDGNVYVSDTDLHGILKVNPAGAVSAFAGDLRDSTVGTADGSVFSARFIRPNGIATDAGGNVYLADSGANTIRKITHSAVVTTLAGRAISFGGAVSRPRSRFQRPTGIAVDVSGNLYVASCYGPEIQKITPSGTVIEIIAKHLVMDPSGQFATEPSHCAAVAIDSKRNIYVADTDNQTVRRLTAAAAVSLSAGLARVTGSSDGSPNVARFCYPSGIAVDTKGNIYVADTSTHVIRKIARSGVVSTFAGTAGIEGSTDGTGHAARFRLPRGIAVDGQGNVYVADTMNMTIRKITPAGLVTTLAGSAGHEGNVDGSGSAARFRRPRGVATDRAGNVYVADTNNHTIRMITPQGVVTTIAGAPRAGRSDDVLGIVARFGNPTGIAVDRNGNIYVADTGSDRIQRVAPAGVTSLWTR